MVLGLKYRGTGNWGWDWEGKGGPSSLVRLATHGTQQDKVGNGKQHTRAITMAAGREKMKNAFAKKLMSARPSRRSSSRRGHSSVSPITTDISLRLCLLYAMPNSNTMPLEQDKNQPETRGSCRVHPTSVDAGCCPSRLPRVPSLVRTCGRPPYAVLRERKRGSWWKNCPIAVRTCRCIRLATCSCLSRPGFASA